MIKTPWKASAKDPHFGFSLTEPDHYATTTILIYAHQAVSMVVHHWTIEGC
jgi:hypothetical protein